MDKLSFRDRWHSFFPKRKNTTYNFISTQRLSAHKNVYGALGKMASQEGFEPPTHALEGRCSIQLSYWDIIKSESSHKKYLLIIISDKIYYMR